MVGYREYPEAGVRIHVEREADAGAVLQGVEGLRVSAIIQPLARCSHPSHVGSCVDTFSVDGVGFSGGFTKEREREIKGEREKVCLCRCV